MPPGTPKVILSPTEQSALDYHRRNLASGTFQRNADGSLTTFKGAIVGLPEGETLIPTYWHGQERDVPSAVRFAMRSGIKFPAYKTAEEAEMRERAIHSIMERDVADYVKSQATKK